MLGYLRETSDAALKSKPSKITGLHKSGLEEYLKIIFPDTTDWLHDKAFGQGIKTRPDYLSPTLKLIVEFDGLPHYLNPDVIRRDSINSTNYENMGYKVVRIPLFIQLTSGVIRKLFNKDISADLVFPEEKAISFSLEERFTPAYFPKAGLARMAKDFISISPEQLKLNLKYLKSLNDDYLSGYFTFIEVLDTVIK